MDGSGKLSPSQSHEPRSKVATAVAAEKAQCVCGRRRGEAHRDSEVGGGGKREGEKGGKGGVRAANTAVERS